MPVHPATAYELLKAFGLLEFELKDDPRYLTADQRGYAKVNWPAVDIAVRQLAPRVFLDQVSVETKANLLGGGRNHPMIQVVAQGAQHARYEPRNLPLHDAEALTVAMRRVRNNLFHGGKEDPLQEPYPGDDEEWATAAMEVAQLLLGLVRNGTL